MPAYLLYLYPIGYNMNIPQFVKERRKLAELTQVELANRAGVGLRFIRELEQGKQTLKMDKVNHILQMFGHQLGPVPMNQDIELTLVNNSFQ